ncbi:unnamed protein product [Notodromas monacha]|uniref:UBX domain-containing protein n=1 Tax=Notodromas monacha TaxID=399045 RepID=A0A7R9BVA3_9CRUS|nr:unnamed protein product [Notodromas monacha]CAG0921265.1 unnamed protein product [Notodromas monacha]
MSQKVTVLYPDGRRTTINVTPNTSLYQVLEEACKKRDFSVDDYSLKHYKTILNPSLTVRFANLPNNALLELVESEASDTISASKVTICLQAEDGTRQTSEFQSSETLWHMLDSFNSNAGKSILKLRGDVVPVCVYANAEIVGEEALRTTSLRKLGMINGRHMIRLLHRPRIEIGVQAHSSVPVAEVPKTQKPSTSRETSPQRLQAKKEVPQKAAPKLGSSDSKPVEKQNTQVKSERSEKKPPKYEVKLNVKDFRVGGSSAEAPRVDAGNSSRSWEGTSGVTLGGKTVADSRTHVAKGDSVFLDDEGTLAFHADSSVHAFPRLNVSDDFFQHTVNDVKYLYRALKSEREAMEEAPLMTAEQRKERERQRKLAACGGVCILRIRFPDKIVLQSLFSPEDNIGAVKARVRKFLQNPNTSFFLYVTPPRRVLSDQDTLISSGCCPTSLLFFGTDDTEQDSFLSDKVMKNLSTATGAISWAQQNRKIVNAVIPASENPKEALADYLGAHAIPDRSAGKGQTNGAPENRRDPPADNAPVPKWFKMKR